MVISLCGNISYDAKTKIATIDIDGNKTTYKVGQTGVNLKSNSFYVDRNVFAKNYNGKCSEINSTGIKGYDLQILVDTNNPNNILGSNKHFGSITNITFDNSTDGESAAGDLNLVLQSGTNRLESVFVGIIGIAVGSHSGWANVGTAIRMARTCFRNFFCRCSHCACRRYLCITIQCIL